jgi:hypothetical protein
MKPCIGLHTTPFDGELIDIGVDNGRVHATPNHRLLTLRGWVEAGRLKVGDILVQIREVATIDKIVANIDDENSLRANLLVPNPINLTCVPETLDAERHSIDLNVNPVMWNIEAKFTLPPLGSESLDHQGFSSSRIGSTVYMPRRIFSVNFLHSINALLFDSWIEKGRGGFQFLRSSSSAFVNILRLAKSWVINPFLPFCQRYPHPARNLSSSGVSDVLPSYGFAFSDLESMPIEQPHDRPVVALPPLSQSADGQQLDAVELIEGFSYGAPLHSFDSLDDFIRWARSHATLSKVVFLSQTLYTDNVYNLSVLDDESYCLPEVVVHNCRCKMYSMSQRDFERNGGKLSVFDLDPEPGFLRKEDIAEKIDQMKVDQRLRGFIRDSMLQA